MGLTEKQEIEAYLELNGQLVDKIVNCCLQKNVPILDLAVMCL